MTTWISLDVEADGPCPGVNSMLSIGAVAFDDDGNELSSFTRNVQPLPDAVCDDKTMKWWCGQPDAWKAATEHAVEPESAIGAFVSWIGTLPKPRVAVAYPAGFDFTFVYWYCHRFVGNSPLGFAAFDLKTYAAALLKLPFKESRKANFPKEWFDAAAPHKHVAVHDAREQGRMLFRMRQWESSNAFLRRITRRERGAVMERCTMCGHVQYEETPDYKEPVVDAPAPNEPCPTCGRTESALERWGRENPYT